MEIFVVTAPGLESIAAGELKGLGVRGNQQPGGVSFSGDHRLLYLANLHLRTPSRVIVRLGRFHASTFYELERRLKKISWQNFLQRDSTVDVRATCRKSRLYHSDAVVERVVAAISEAGVPVHLHKSESTASDDGEELSVGNDASQLFVVRIVNDQCEISADSSGALLHRRGYRLETSKAPLRETLAAAMILASGWRPRDPLVDPLCGSGTIPIEAAMLARRIAPGLRRNFQFMRWPTFDAALWKELTSIAEADIVPGEMIGATIRGADRDAGATAAAVRNAERAGVAANVDFSTQSLSTTLDALPDAPGGEGWILTNPPYGIRVGERDLRNLYARLGSVLQRNPAWRLGVLAAEEHLVRQGGIRLRSRFDTKNGGIPVSFLASEKAGKSPGSARDSDQ
ncbi:MAG TPA: class I SAM-dependent RNA methyltransferase [Gemmatimonadaceae bacterium]|nr:class I SAM-dependent RNA methyltransferase [Gemmatimonadaceae bacterium]